jgi:hypothetical protein
MKLVMTLLVRDEEDIVASNIDFHLEHGVDFIVATDNLSVDRTPDILRGYERRGLLHYIHQPEDTYAQNRWVTHMARIAHTEFGADWVINNDADEFWWPEQGDLKQELGGVAPTADAVIVPRTNFVPRPMASDEFFADVMTVRERHSLNPLGKPLPPKACHRGFADIVVAQGNHGVSRNGRTLQGTNAPIIIMHFPMRTYRHFASITAKRGAAYARNPELPPGASVARRQMYEMWKRGELEDYYRSRLLDDAAIERGLAEGRLVNDDRLKVALARLRRL